MAGQPLGLKLADIVYDRFVAEEKAEAFGDLTVHYQVPLVDGESFYMELKTGTYPACTPNGS